MIRSKMLTKDTARWRTKFKAFASGVEQGGEATTKKLATDYKDDAKGWMGKISPSGGSGPFGAVWERLSARWIASKKKRGKVEQIWEETGAIKASVKVSKSGKGYFSGISRQDSPQPYDRALKNEFGLWRSVHTRLGNIGRPLFRPLATYYKLRIAPVAFRSVLRRALKVWR